MLPPHELKNKKFTHAIRGYSVSEVDDYVEFLLERYADVYRRNDQLEKELRMVMVRLEELTEKEDAINRALVNAQRIEDKLVKEANEKAELITRAAKTNADKILNDFHRKISKERVVLHQLRGMVEEFKKYMLSSYEEQIESINLLSPPMYDEPEWETDPEEYTEKVLEGIRDAANQAAENNEKKHRLEEIMEAHTEKSDMGEVAPQLKKTGEAVSNVPASPAPEEKTVSKEETGAVVPVENDPVNVEEPEGVPAPIMPITMGMKRRPRARRTIDSSVQTKQQPIPSSPGESGDTEAALDLLFSESAK